MIGSREVWTRSTGRYLLRAIAGDAAAAMRSASGPRSAECPVETSEWSSRGHGVGWRFQTTQESGGGAAVHAPRGMTDQASTRKPNCWTQICWRVGCLERGGSTGQPGPISPQPAIYPASSGTFREAGAVKRPRRRLRRAQGPAVGRCRMESGVRLAASLRTSLGSGRRWGAPVYCRHACTFGTRNGAEAEVARRPPRLLPYILRKLYVRSGVAR